MRYMMRTLIPAAALFFGLTVAASAYYFPASREGPWCLNITFGMDGTESDCSYASFEQCRPHTIGGNRGFCEQNPRWHGPDIVVRRRAKRPQY
ncbi:MAG: DUF3551 domain-containing protein [Pseudolabrys sp.]